MHQPVCDPKAPVQEAQRVRAHAPPGSARHPCLFVHQRHNQPATHLVPTAFTTGTEASGPPRSLPATSTSACGRSCSFCPPRSPTQCPSPPAAETSTHHANSEICWQSRMFAVAKFFLRFGNAKPQRPTWESAAAPLLLYIFCIQAMAKVQTAA